MTLIWNSRIRSVLASFLERTVLGLLSLSWDSQLLKSRISLHAAWLGAAMCWPGSAQGALRCCSCVCMAAGGLWARCWATAQWKCCAPTSTCTEAALLPASCVAASLLLGPLCGAVQSTKKHQSTAQSSARCALESVHGTAHLNRGTSQSDYCWFPSSLCVLSLHA